MSKNRRQRPVSEGSSRLSWLDLPKQDETSGTQTPPLIHVREEKEEDTVQGKHLQLHVVIMSSPAT